MSAVNKILSRKKTPSKTKKVRKTKAVKKSTKSKVSKSSKRTKRPKKVKKVKKVKDVKKVPLTDEQKREKRRQERKRRMDRIFDESNDYDEIIPRLWLGSEDAALSGSFVENKEIKGVLNCTPSVPHKFKGKGIEYVRIPVDDSLKMLDINKMTIYLPYIVQNLRIMHHDQKRNVLVHCHAGMQRSAIIVAAYLVQYYNKTPSEAIKYIIKRRPIAFYNGDSINFEKSLNTFYHNLKRFAIHKS